jgi:NAD(P)-dependent dehydrogenase (short-subunit alcohol dehydrogenase family)
LILRLQRIASENGLSSGVTVKQWVIFQDPTILHVAQLLRASDRHDSKAVSRKCVDKHQGRNTSMFNTVLVAGASRGIGLAVSEYLEPKVNRLLAVSRTASSIGEWVRADLTHLADVEIVKQAIGSDTLDALLYMGGTWETNAFTSQYCFETCSDEDIARVIAVNLTAPIRLVKALLPALRRSDNPKIVLMGALSGRDNFPGREVANSASKFGLRGAVHALREELRSQQIGVTIINPGNVGTPEVLADLAEESLLGGHAIPLADLLKIIDCVLSLSRSTCIKEIDVPAMLGHGA